MGKAIGRALVGKESDVPTKDAKVGPKIAAEDINRNLSIAPVRSNRERQGKFLLND